MGKSYDIFEMSVEMPERKLVGRVARAERIGPPPGFQRDCLFRDVRRRDASFQGGSWPIPD